MPLLISACPGAQPCFWPQPLSTRLCHVLGSSGYPECVRKWSGPFPRVSLGNYTEEEFLELQRLNPTFTHWELARPVVGLNPLSVSLLLAGLQSGEGGTPQEAYQRMRHEYHEKAVRVFRASTAETFSQMMHNIFSLFHHRPVENTSAYIDIADSGLVQLSTDSQHLTFINSLAAEAVWEQVQARLTGRPTDNVTLVALAKSVCHALLFVVWRDSIAFSLHRLKTRLLLSLDMPASLPPG